MFPQILTHSIFISWNVSQDSKLAINYTYLELAIDHLLETSKWNKLVCILGVHKTICID